MIEILTPSDQGYSALTPVCSESIGCPQVQIDPSAEIIAQDSAGSRYRLGPVVIDERDIARAEAQDVGGTGPSPTTEWVVSYELTSAGADAFALATRAALAEQSPRNRIATLVDEIVVSAPEVRAPITSGLGIINGGYTQQQAQTLAFGLTQPPVSS